MTQRPSHRNTARLWVTLWLLTTGCGPTLPQELDLEATSRAGTCLVQVYAGLIEIVTFGGYRTVNLPARDALGLDPSGVVSPDGRSIAAARELESRHVLVGITLEGRELWSANAPLSGAPAFSSDGTRVVFASEGHLAIYDVIANRLERLPLSGANPAWAPGSDRIAVDDGGTVRVYDLKSGTHVDVGPGTDPVWFPDGSRIAVRADNDRIDAVDLRTQERHTFLNGRNIRMPRWSSDGRWMAYSYFTGAAWWSWSEAAQEPHHIFVRETSSGRTGVIGKYFKANPGRYDWVTNSAICSPG